MESISVINEVTFSEDKQYRYFLKKEWDSKKPKVSIIMTNPSAADIIVSNYTTMFITNNLAQLSYGSFSALNIVPLVTKSLKLKIVRISQMKCVKKTQSMFRNRLNIHKKS